MSAGEAQGPHPPAPSPPRGGEGESLHRKDGGEASPSNNVPSRNPSWWQSLPQSRTLGLAALGTAIAAVQPLITLAAVVGAVTAAGVLAQPVIGLFLLAWSVPFQSLVATKLGLFRISLTEGLVFLFIISWVLTQRRTMTTARPALLRVGLLMLAVLMLSALRSRQVDPSIKEVIKWAEFIAVYWATVTLLRGSPWRWPVVGCLLAAATAQAALGVQQTIWGAGPAHFMAGTLFLRAYGTFGQPNPFAGYLELFFPIAFALWAFGDLEARMPWIRSLVAAVMAVLGIALVLSLSRGGLLGVAGATALVLVLGSRGTRQVTLAVGALLVVGALGGWYLLPREISQPAATMALDAFSVAAVVDTPVTPQNWSVMERLSQWHAGWRMFQDNYVFGVGAGNYDLYYPDFALPYWPQALGHAHNLYLNIAAESGLLGLGAYLLLVAGVVGLGRRALRTAGDRASRALALGILGSLMAYSIHSLFDMLFVHGIGVLLGILIALLEVAAPAGSRPAAGQAAGASA